MFLSKSAGGRILAVTDDDENFKVAISRNAQSVLARLLATRSDVLSSASATMQGGVFDAAIRAGVSEGLPRLRPIYYIFEKEPRFGTTEVVVELKRSTLSLMLLNCVIEVVGDGEYRSVGGRGRIL